MAPMLAAILGKKLHILFFCIKGNVYNIWCRKTTSHFGVHVGNHFGEKGYTYFYFVTKVMCTKCGAERPTSHFSQGRPLAMAAILVAILEKKVDEKLHLNAKIQYAKFGYKRPDGLGGVGEITHRQTHRQD